MTATSTAAPADPLADRPKGARFTVEQEAALRDEMQRTSLSAVAKARGLSKSVLTKLRDRSPQAAQEGPQKAASAPDALPAATLPGDTPEGAGDAPAPAAAAIFGDHAGDGAEVIAAEPVEAEEGGALVPAAADLPAFCRRAVAALATAATLPEVQKIAARAEAFAAYTRRINAAREARNEVERVILLAEATIGAKLAEGQERGEVATRSAHGAGIQASMTAGHTRPATLAEIGLSPKEAMTARRLAAAGLDAINAEVDAATAEGRAPSRARIIRPAASTPPDDAPPRPPKPEPSPMSHGLPSRPAHTLPAPWAGDPVAEAEAESLSPQARAFIIRLCDLAPDAWTAPGIADKAPTLHARCVEAVQRMAAALAKAEGTA